MAMFKKSLCNAGGWGVCVGSVDDDNWSMAMSVIMYTKQKREEKREGERRMITTRFK